MRRLEARQSRPCRGCRRRTVSDAPSVARGRPRAAGRRATTGPDPRRSSRRTSAGRPRRARSPRRAHEAGDVELGRRARVLGDPDRLAVQQHEERPLRSAEAEHDAALAPAARRSEPAPVDPGRILVGHLGRAVPERHLNVRVLRAAETLHRPEPGHVDRLPAPCAPSATAASSGRAATRKSHSPSRDAYQGERHGSSFAASSADRNGTRVACGSSRFRLVSSGFCQLGLPPRWRSASIVIRRS